MIIRDLTLQNIISLKKKSPKPLDAVDFDHSIKNLNIELGTKRRCSAEIGSEI